MNYFLILSLIFILSCEGIFNDEKYNPPEENHPFPQHIRVVSISENVLKIEWSSLWGEYLESKFQIERSTDGETFTILQNEIRETFSFDYSINPDLQYTYRLKAYNSKKVSDYKYFKVKYDLFNILKRKIDYPFTQELKLSKTGRFLGASSKNLITVWDSESWDEVLSLTDDCEFILDFQFNEDQNMIAFAADSIIKIKQLINSQSLNEIPINNKVNLLALNSDFSKIAVSTYSNNGINLIYNIGFYSINGSQIWELKNVETVYGLLYSQSKDELICCLYGGKILIINVEDGQILKEIQTEGDIFQSPFLNSEGNELITLNTYDRKYIYILNLNDWSSSKSYLGESYHNSVLNLRLIEDQDSYVYSDANFIRFLNSGSNSFTSTLDIITELEYSSLNGDIILTSPNEPIYIFSTEKQKQWQSY